VGTALLSLGLLLLGIVAYRLLPVAPLPRVEFPVIQVSASLPGADPATMASSVAAPLERRLGQIAGISEMTSTSSIGSVSITLQFELTRSLSSASKDVQAAINAAGSDLPSTLPYPPTYRRYSPNDSPVMILSLTSELLPLNKLYELADTVLGQRLSQVEGVSQTAISGSSKSAVRIRMNPGALALAGLSMEDVRAAVALSNIRLPKGALDSGGQTYTLETNDQIETPEDFGALVVAQKNGRPVALRDLGEVFEGVENSRVGGWSGTTPAILISVYKQADANVIQTVDGIRAVLPQLQAWLPPAAKLQIMSDRTRTIRGSVEEVQKSMLLSVALVVLVMLVFLRRAWPTFIASITVPMALAGTFGAMYLLDYSLNNLSLMALTIAVGFVVDDAIVVIENIVRFLEDGRSPWESALLGARQIGFTVISITVSLVAVFIPLLFMGGLIGRLFHEFAMTLSLAVGVSAVISLTLTPSLCARFLRPHAEQPPPGFIQRALETVLSWIQRAYEITLRFALRQRALMLLLTVGSIGASVYLYGKVPKGFFPQQDSGMLMAMVETAPDTSFATMSEIQKRAAGLVMQDPAVSAVSSYIGASHFGGAGNSGRMFITLKALGERDATADAVAARIRKQTASIEGARVFLIAMQDVRVGGRSSKSMYQYSLQSPDPAELNEWAPRIVSALRKLPQLRDVTSDVVTGGLKTNVTIQRDAAARLGVNVGEIDATLYDAFGQRLVSTVYKRYNQHRVVLELDAPFLENPASLDQIFIRSSNGPMVPLQSVARIHTSTSQLTVNHQGQFPAITVSFNLSPGISLGEATELITDTIADMQLPESVRGSFQGTAQVFQDSLSTLPLLIAWALLAVYLVLGILYESLLHPLTILSTLPSAGLGALLALQMSGYELSIVSFIGIILLMGIVKKNAIMMVDFAIEARRKEPEMRPHDAIYAACATRFRPITMTTLAALFGSLPLAFGSGMGSELRRPLGVAIVGGLVVSQILTLYTTPVVYLLLEKIREFMRSLFRRKDPGTPRSSKSTIISESTISGSTSPCAPFATPVTEAARPQ
jgi:hydrophobe/amphiphile efflux-1 (HAE1) family protein